GGCEWKAGGAEAEAVALGIPHPRARAGEDGGGKDPASGVRPAGQLLAAAEEPRPFLLSDLDVAQDALALLLRDAGSHLHGGIEAVADPERLDARHEPGEESVIDRSVH